MRPLKNRCEIAVIGGGLAGLAAARHAVRLGRLVTLFEHSGMFGGQVATVGYVDGLPFPGDFSGQDLAMHLLEQIRKAGVQVIEAGVKQVGLDPRLELLDDANNTWRPHAIVVASGASLRRLGVPGEDRLYGRGVSRCATCDGGFFRSEHVVVAGGGDGAVHEALELAKTSRQVTMVCRSPLRAQREYIDRLAGRENVDFIWDTEITEIAGDDGVRAVALRNVHNGAISELACAAVFPFIGATPNSAFLPASLLTPSGHVRADAAGATAIPGIFAAGAVRAGFVGTAVQAMAEGIGAAAAGAALLAANA